jgi:hypothetical protein
MLLIDSNQIISQIMFLLQLLNAETKNERPHTGFKNLNNLLGVDGIETGQAQSHNFMAHLAVGKHRFAILHM